MDDNKADTLLGDVLSRRDYRSGSLFQKCEARFGCPPLVDGHRPDHKCEGRWFGTMEAGYTANGSRRRVTVSAKSKKTVQRRLRDKRAELEREGHRNVKRTTSVARWSEVWLQNIQPQVRPSAYDTDQAAVRTIVAAIGATKLGDLTPDDVRRVARHIRTKGLSTSTALRYHGSLMRMLKAAAIDGYSVPPNVMLVDNPTAAVNDREAIPLETSIKALSHIASLPDGSRWATAFLQGHRQAESLGLTWPQIDFEVGSLTISWQLQSLRYVDRTQPELGFRVPDGYEARHLVGATHLVRPKSTAGWRVQPLTTWAANALLAWREVAPENPHGLVWPGRTLRGRTWPRNAAGDRAEWHAIQASAGIHHPSRVSKAGDPEPYHVHEIRHGTATLLLALGVPESVRVAIMGHSSVASTRTYEHVDLTLAREALEKAATKLQLGQ